MRVNLDTDRTWVLLLAVMEMITTKLDSRFRATTRPAITSLHPKESEGSTKVTSRQRVTKTLLEFPLA